ncbi:hypothetical protein QBC35DRAFT_508420 [Podospora australis]|uniref:Polymerase nucleotidyl transferase domain-containing protein n=1 Tax=Podospora australis TaxID=1536484 RepID=A0AAN7AE54_9PEZI|nr:hypothetical protein QBC35DRAFT_508420 [Podospora australis]
MEIQMHPNVIHPHHRDSIINIVNHFKDDPTIDALLLTGSIAHGFAAEISDVDMLILVNEAEYDRREAEGNITVVLHDLCPYEGGYLDAKYTSLKFMRQVVQFGSEPARWAFKDSAALFVRNGVEAELVDLLNRIPVYPLAEQQERIKKFRTQLQIWNWYVGEGRRKKNAYLTNVAASKLVLFAGRLVLAHNAVLYPYHKWFLRVLEEVKEKPKGLMKKIEAVNSDPSQENTNALFELVVNWQDWARPAHRWGAQFMVDSELNWLILQTPVDDI